MARPKTNRQVAAPENFSSKRASEGRKTKRSNKTTRRRPNRKGKKEKTVKPRKDNEGYKKCTNKGLHL